MLFLFLLLLFVLGNVLLEEAMGAVIVSRLEVLM